MPWLHCAWSVVLHRSQWFPDNHKKEEFSHVRTPNRKFCYLAEHMVNFANFPRKRAPSAHLPWQLSGSHLAEHCSRDFPRLPGRLILLGCSSSCYGGGCGVSRTCFLMSNVTWRWSVRKDLYLPWAWYGVLFWLSKGDRPSCCSRNFKPLSDGELGISNLISVCHWPALS